LNMCLLTCNF